MNRKIVLALLILVALAVAGGALVAFISGRGELGGESDPALTGDTNSSSHPLVEPTVLARESVIPQPTPWPTNVREIAPKDQGIAMLNEVNKMAGDLQEQLNKMRVEGTDVRAYHDDLRKLNFEISKAGFQLHNATDTVSTSAAETNIGDVRERIRTLAEAAGVSL